MAQTSDTQPDALTDGFHLIIDALKLNGISTIYGVPGIPITDLGRAVREALASGRPTLVNAVIDEQAGTESGRIGNLNPQSAVSRKQTQ